jgi:putative inorganic carbon (hco3(-)) transporter
MEYPSANQWSGYADIALVLLTILPILLAATMVSVSPLFLGVSVALALVLILEISLLYSRAAYPSMIATYLALSALETLKLRRFRLAAAAVIAVLAISAGVSHPLRSAEGFLTGRSYESSGRGLGSTRLIIWGRALELIRDHPWLGVGPDNYPAAIRAGYLRPTDREWDTPSYAAHAHNMVLHIAAESGIPAAVAFLIIWWRLLSALARVCARDHLGMIAIGVFGALLAFFVRSLTDHFLAGFHSSNRLSFLLWTLFAAAAAVVRLHDVRTRGIEKPPQTYAAVQRV